MTYEEKIFVAEKFRGSYWAERIAAEIGYAARVSRVNGDKHKEIIEQAADYLISAYENDGALTNQAAQTAEQMLTPVSEDAKKLTVYLVSHAHLDMNWKWGYNETVVLTIETFRTMLDLMNEYDQFVFSHSQAAAYQIIEEFAPEMLDEIRQRIKEGRWEAFPSSWTEPDRNLSSGESLSRHILYTKKYMKKLFGIEPESLQVDFVPDAFGHSISIPEILARGGIKYMYIMRGCDREHLFKWRARSGETVLAFRERYSYKGAIRYDSFADMPVLCKKSDIDFELKIYGVCNHGGGPTRRDIETALDMQTWPVMAKLEFSSYINFFKRLELHADKFNTVEDELNFIFTGCYTSTSRIKMANRISEARLFDSEMLCAGAALLGSKDYGESFRKAWERVMYNQFHDILPGCGITETREHAMGIFQEAMAYADANASHAMRHIASLIDTSSVALCGDIKRSTSEGAGAGFRVSVEDTVKYAFPATERGAGNTRILHLFNTTQFHRKEIVNVTVWDLPYEARYAQITDGDRNPVNYRVVTERGEYWDHLYSAFAIETDIPPFSYKTYVIERGQRRAVLDTLRGGKPWHDSNRKISGKDDDIILENDQVRAVFERLTMRLISYTDKSSGKELITNPAAYFALTTEDSSSAYAIGAYMQTADLNQTCNVRLLSREDRGIFKQFAYEIKFNSSALKATVSLKKGSRTLEFTTETDWREQSSHDSAPHLSFNVPLGYKAGAYKYDVPFGILERPDLNEDCPANGNGIAAGVPEGEGACIAVVNDTRYAYRCTKNSISLTLLHTTIKPDPYPETGRHTVRIGIVAAENSGNAALIEAADTFNHPIAYVTNKPHAGKLPFSTAQFFNVSNNVHISSVKTPENPPDKKPGSLIVRLYDITGVSGRVTLNFALEPKSAASVDLNESPYSFAGDPVKNLSVAGKTVSFDINAHSAATLLVSLS